jgi:DNA-3-methyladenine glycosylase II
MPQTDFLKGAAAVARRDPAMAALIKRIGPPDLRSPNRRGAFYALVQAITYQQLAGRAAAAIHGRFVALFDGRLTPEAVLAMPEKALLSAGLSRAKAASIRDLAAKSLDRTVPLRTLSRLPDEEIIERLIQVRGIGRWTAEMFLIFQLHRPDVWPIDDYGVRQGWALAHRWPALPTPKELQAEGERFHPYRTVVAWYCWQAVHEARGQIAET